MLQMFLGKLKLLFKSSMVIFIYGIIAKWYVMIIVAAIVVIFLVLAVLKDSIFLEEVEKVGSKALDGSKLVARYCIPKVMSCNDFWDCLESPQKYFLTKNEKAFEEDLTDLLDFNSCDQSKDPYVDTGSNKYSLTNYSMGL
jgi:hypothetical protein